MRFVAVLALALLALPLPAAPPEAPTSVKDATALRRLHKNSGMTLQWISFDSAKRGHVAVTTKSGLVHLHGTQQSPNSTARVTLDGDVVAIDARSFTFRGQIVITDAPDVGRNCVRDGDFEFRATGKRRYWRLQQMETCDKLTDYVDIYY